MEIEDDIIEEIQLLEKELLELGFTKKRIDELYNIFVHVLED